MSTIRDTTSQQIATALHLSPATVRMYARDGRIPFDTTPGRQRRFNLDEVRQALAIATESRGTGGGGPQGVRTWLVDAEDLDAWADRREAEDKLPDLVRRLIVGSNPDLRRIDGFRTGKGITIGGWDGLVEAARETLWVPPGTSAWELGTDENVTAKATADYNKRTQDPLGIQPSETVFVFVTPRRWSRKDSWVTTRRAERVWKDVRAYDGESLKQWLESTPAVHASVTRMLGRDPNGAADLTAAWATWAEQTSPVLPPALFTSGREKERQHVADWPLLTPTVISVVADSQDEALAFVLACLMQLPEERRLAVEARTLVIYTEAAWNQVLERFSTPVYLIPMFSSPAVLRAIQAGHHVILPLDSNALTTGESIALPQLNYDQAVAALVGAGVPEHQAGELAMLARRSLVMLRRRLAVNPGVKRPQWAEAERANEVIPVVLAGAWREDVQADCDLLAALANRPYSGLAELLAQWGNQADPPVKAVGTLWFVTSREDAWKLTSRYLTAAQLQRFSDRASEVLSALDPALELEPERRWAAGLWGKTLPWSKDLRKGLADTVALIGARSGVKTLVGGETGQQFADRIVWALLAKANADSSGQLWPSLTDLLPALAEASPAQFLDAVDTGLRSGLLMSVFDAAAEATKLAWPAHTGLLWALEALAWSPEYLGAAAVALAKLAERDPGDASNWGNRPLRSLREIFIGWSPHTSATLDERFDALDGLRQAVPEAAWKLMIGLLPLPHDVSTPTYRPRWRGWEPEEPLPVTVAEWQHHVDGVVERLLQDARADASRWADIVKVLDNLPETAHETVVRRLQQLDPAGMGPEERERITDALRSVVHTHLRFPDAKWALPSQHVDRLETELRRFESNDPVAGTLWLFRQHVALPTPLTGDFRVEERALSHAREEAVRTCLSVGGIEAVWTIAERCESPGWVGITLGRVSGEFDDVVLPDLTAPPPREEVARGYLIGRFEAGGWEWANNRLDQAAEWPPERTVGFLRLLPAEPAIFDRAEQFGSAVARAYWETVPEYALLGSSDRIRAVRMLLANGRAITALSIIDSCMRADPDGGTVEAGLVLQALADARPDPSRDDLTMLSFHIANLLNYLDAREDVDRLQLAQFELRYLPLFAHQQRLPRVLHEELARDPSFFAEVISWSYRSDAESHDSGDSDEMRFRATLGDQLLSSWRTPPNGSGDGVLHLAAWVATARTLLAERGLIRVGDLRIGALLRYTSADSSGAWPNAQVREIIERASSQDLERGIEAEIYHRSTSRGPTEGGAQERALAQRYAGYARQIGNRWPRTRLMLGRIVEFFERDARRQDDMAEVVENFRS